MTVRNYVEASATSRTEALKKEFSGYFSLTPGSIAIDYGQRLEDYLSVVYHGLKLSDNKLVMQELVIGFIPSANEKNANNIWNEINDAVNYLDIFPEQLYSMIGISDEGSNVVKALKHNFDESKL